LPEDFAKLRNQVALKKTIDTYIKEYSAAREKYQLSISRDFCTIIYAYFFNNNKVVDVLKNIRFAILLRKIQIIYY
jgi:hypothetical protein